MGSSAMQRIVRWRGLADDTREHAAVRLGLDGLSAASVLVGTIAGVAVALRVRLEVDHAGATTRFEVTPRGGRGLVLVGDGRGRWRDGDGRPLPELDACLDVDLGASPLTNSLPIRRLGLAEGETRVVRVAHIAVPTLAVAAVTQRYTRLAGGRWRYAGFPPGFAAELSVDGDGLVTDYDGMFRREP